jgi:hypothetical protein
MAPREDAAAVEPGAAHPEAKALRTGLLVWLSVLALALAAYAAVQVAEARAQVEEGWAALRSGEPQHAEELLARAARWAWQRDRVTSGLLLARTAQGKAVAVGPLSVAASPSFREELSRQMERAWTGRHSAAVRSLASLAARAGHPLAPVYEAALALDAGDETRARECLGTAPWASRGVRWERERSYGTAGAVPSAT